MIEAVMIIGYFRRERGIKVDNPPYLDDKR